MVSAKCTVRTNSNFTNRINVHPLCANSRGIICSSEKYLFSCGIFCTSASSELDHVCRACRSRKDKRHRLLCICVMSVSNTSNFICAITSGVCKLESAYNIQCVRRSICVYSNSISRSINIQIIICRASTNIEVVIIIKTTYVVISISKINLLTCCFI